VAKFEFLMASSLVGGVILSVAVLQAERRISATTLSATGDPSARWQKRGLFGMTPCEVQNFKLSHYRTPAFFDSRMATP